MVTKHLMDLLNGQGKLPKNVVFFYTFQLFGWDISSIFLGHGFRLFFLEN